MPFSRSLSDPETVFRGLPDGLGPYDLLLMIKKAGKGLGFTPRMIGLLEYYMAFTRPCDWAENSKTGPVVYQSLSRTAMDLGLSERQVQRLEKQLHELGVLCWKDSGNHKRFGQRCKQSGALVYAYGADLTPLSGWVARLQDYLAQKKQRDHEWLKTKREISVYRRTSRTMLSELALMDPQVADTLSETYNKNLARPAIRIGMALEELQILHRALRDFNLSLRETLRSEIPDFQGVLPDNLSSQDDKRVVHNQYKTQKQSDKSDFKKCVFENRGRGSEPQDEAEQNLKHHAAVNAGLDKISLRDALLHLPADMMEQLSLQCRGQVRGWNDLIETAYAYGKSLGISQSDWARACSVLTRHGAAICVILSARAMQRPNQAVQKPGAYFRAMIDRGARHQLHLAASLRLGSGRDN